MIFLEELGMLRGQIAVVLKDFLIPRGVYAKALEQVEISLFCYCLGRGGVREAGRGAGGSRACLSGDMWVLPEWLHHSQATY